MKSHEITRKIKNSAIWADFNDLDHNTNMTHVLNGGQALLPYNATN